MIFDAGLAQAFIVIVVVAVVAGLSQVNWGRAPRGRHRKER